MTFIPIEGKSKSYKYSLIIYWTALVQYIKYTKMYLLYRIYGPHTTKFVVYAAIVTALHEIIDLKHRSPHFRLYSLIVLGCFVWNWDLLYMLGQLKVGRVANK